MTTPDEARAEARAALTPERRAQLARVVERYRARYHAYLAVTRAQQDADFEAREAAHEREQEQRQ